MEMTRGVKRLPLGEDKRAKEFLLCRNDKKEGKGVVLLRNRNYKKEGRSSRCRAPEKPQKINTRVSGRMSSYFDNTPFNPSHIDLIFSSASSEFSSLSNFILSVPGLFFI